ncbi:MAG: exosome complex protein Rrp4 [Methanobrevibacter sp.]|jgi:exosome complex component RRP4|nr:exosome complex protein Rrp4 [Methanobrevibacter sp.]
MIHVNNKDLVVPGEILAEDDYYSGRGTFKDNGKICSSLTGLVSLRNKKISVIPLKSKYLPKRGDVVIGKIVDVRFSMWEVGLNSPYSGILPASEVFGREKKELSKVFKLGDVLFLRVVDVDEVKKVKLGLKGRGMGKFKGGIIVNITPTKVPRLIGKKGSMINMIKDKTGCKIVVGQNGLVWVKGDKKMELITKEVIEIIEAEAHTSGLTNRIKNKLYLLVDGEIPEDVEEGYDNFYNSQDPHQETKESFKDASTSDEEYFEKPKLQNFKEELKIDTENEPELKAETVTEPELKAETVSEPELKAETVSEPELKTESESKAVAESGSETGILEDDNNKIKDVVIESTEVSGDGEVLSEAVEVLVDDGEVVGEVAEVVVDDSEVSPNVSFLDSSKEEKEEGTNKETTEVKEEETVKETEEVKEEVTDKETEEVKEEVTEEKEGENNEDNSQEDSNTFKPKFSFLNKE